MKTIAQQLNIKTFPLEIKVEGKQVYYEDESYWVKAEYQDGKCVYFKNSDGFWEKREYQDGNEVYCENSKGYWRKCEFQDGKCVYFEDSGGYIRDDRPKSKAQAKVAEARKLLEEAQRELKETP